MLDSLNPLSEDAEHRSVIDKNWKEGVDYFRVEPTLICHDGESVQVGNGRRWAGTGVGIVNPCRHTAEWHSSAFGNSGTLLSVFHGYKCHAFVYAGFLRD